MEALKTLPLSRFEQLRFAREVLRIEGESLIALGARLPDSFGEAVDRILACEGIVLVTGMGKAGLIAQKVAATLTSTGTNSQFLHPGEAVHGDLGRVQRRDVILALSFSGETEELIRLLPAFHQVPAPLIAMTGNESSTLARAAQVVLALGPLREACPFGLAPTTSTTAMLALGDALALVLSRMRNFGPSDFARNHPGGNLGRKLTRVEEVMRRRDDCRIAHEGQTIREVFVMASRPGRRTGAIMLIDDDEKLSGLFTDSDLARLLERRRDHVLDDPIRQVMTRSPTTLEIGSMMSAAIQLLVERKISELPIVDKLGKPAGLVDITDVVAWLPAPAEPETSSNSAPLSDTPSSNTVLYPNHFTRRSRT